MDAKTERKPGGAADKLLDNPGLTVERLPMLTVIFDRLAASCAEGMRPYLRHPFLLRQLHHHRPRLGRARRL